MEVVVCHTQKNNNNNNNTITLAHPYRSRAYSPYGRMMMPRFLAIDDPTVAVMICRDLDSRFHVRELLAVNQWLSSTYHVHSMRDHPLHKRPLMGGMWGVKRGWGHNMTDLFRQVLRDFRDTDISTNSGFNGNTGYDQEFLASYVWPLVRTDTFTHDSVVRPNCFKLLGVARKNRPCGNDYPMDRTV